MIRNNILPEIVSVGIYNASVAVKNKAVTQNRKTTMFEIELPIEQGGISYISSSSHPITENLLICAKPGQLRHTRLPFKCYYIHMIVEDERLYNMLMELPNFIELSERARIKSIFECLCENYSIGTYESELKLTSLLYDLLHTIKKHSGGNKANGYLANNHKVVEKTIKYINDNLNANLSLEILAHEMSFTPVYFHKLFKASTGKTLREYIEDQRIKKAIELMMSTNMTLTEISYECGFSSQSYFSYAFNRKMKISPRKYAKNILNQYEK